MIEFTRGDIFTQDVDILVNPVNCKGVMGKGLALLFKKRWPDLDVEYKQFCADGMLKPGGVFSYATEKGPVIYCVATKDHWLNSSKPEWIFKGLMNIRFRLEANSIPEIHHSPSIAVPPLGCGLGGLEWDTVRPAIVGILGGYDGKVIVLEP